MRHHARHGLRRAVHSLPAWVKVTIPSLAIIGGGTFTLVSANAGTTTQTINGCVKSTSTVTARTIYDVYLNKTVKCPKGSFGVTWNVQGPVGPRGPAGPAGPAGASGLLTVSATAAVSSWPETGGWATDDFTRTVTLTRQHAAAASHCGSGASQCWFYTETLADNGSFTTAAGAHSPNGSSSAMINGIISGNMIGGGEIEFYASSDTPNPSLVPATVDGSSARPSTTYWYKQFFPDGTQFGESPPQAGNGPWTTYDWKYTAPKTCETWNDGINPGDDGSGTADGNITGVNACTA